MHCYAPTNDQNKGHFYSHLQNHVTEEPKHDLLTTMGDVNMNVGNDNTGLDAITGT